MDVKADSPAARAGMQAGDRISGVDGIANPTWEQLQPREWLSPNQPLTVTIQRGDQTFRRPSCPSRSPHLRSAPPDGTRRTGHRRPN